MELKHVRAFLAVARTGSFTEAAADLHYSQSTVTEQVQALESELGVQLFDRSGRRPALTGPGKVLIDYAEQLVDLSRQAQVAVRRELEPTGTLTVGGLETLCAHRIPELLVRFRDDCQQVRVIVRQGTRGELFESVRRGTIDAAFTFGGPPPGLGLTTRVLESVRLMVVAPPGHPLAGSARVLRADLAGARFLATEQGCGFREMYDTAFTSPSGSGDAGLVLVAEVGSMAALRSCVASGLGLALLPEIVVADQIDRGELVGLALDADEYGLPACTTVNASWSSRLEQPTELTRFLDVVSAS